MKNEHFMSYKTKYISSTNNEYYEVKFDTVRFDAILECYYLEY